MPERGLLGRDSEGIFQYLLFPGIFGVDFILSEKFSFRVVV